MTPDRLRRALRDARARHLTAEELAASALVLAPHPDDEVLGCGGTVIRKRDAGARVTIAWLTDGRKSHAHLMDAQELAALRREEALCAADRLGVPRADTVLLDFENGKLEEQQAAATAAVAALVSERRPEQVLLPCPWDVWPDHLATTATGRALRSSGYQVSCSATRSGSGTAGRGPPHPRAPRRRARPCERSPATGGCGASFASRSTWQTCSSASVRPSASTARRWSG